MLENEILGRVNIQFGKIAFTGARKINEVEVSIELRKRGKADRVYDGNGTLIQAVPRLEFAASCKVWNNIHTDVVITGQCLDEVRPFLKNNDDFNLIYDLWKEWHLNSLHAGTPEQERIIDLLIGTDAMPEYDYRKAKSFLKALGIETMHYTGFSSGNEDDIYMDHALYSYGYSWLYRDIPVSVINAVYELTQKYGGEWNAELLNGDNVIIAHGGNERVNWDIKTSAKALGISIEEYMRRNGLPIREQKIPEMIETLRTLVNAGAINEALNEIALV